MMHLLKFHLCRVIALYMDNIAIYICFVNISYKCIFLPWLYTFVLLLHILCSCDTKDISNEVVCFQQQIKKFIYCTSKVIFK